ncbi:unnamed protein product [Rhodiola kirilowii]
MEVEEATREAENGTAELVRWERFLPRMGLRVLLVEPDDSTRHVISALLRKCSYEVNSISDGLDAWERLKEKPQSIDLVLTEVDLPSISGFTLLTLVMNHDASRIPVIMMSSQDSISTVLKCMLKGAADFLIKPIRKNELKNLWQHVWRRRISTAENKFLSTGEECQKIGATSEKTAASSPLNDYISSEQEEVECKETKIASKHFSQMECEDTMDKIKTDNDLDEECLQIDKELGLHGSKIREFRLETLCKEIGNSSTLRVLDDDTSVKRAKYGDSEEPRIQREDRNGALELRERDTLLLESRPLAAIGLIGSFGTVKRKCEISNFTVGKPSPACGPRLELSLSLQRSDPSGPRSSEPDEGRLLNHSSASAFSRYNSGYRYRFSSPLSATSNSKAQRTMSTMNESKQVHQSYLRTAVRNNADKCTAVISDQSEQAGNASASSLVLVQPQGSSENLNKDYGSLSPLDAQACQTVAWSIHQSGKPDQSSVEPSNSGSSKLQKGACADSTNAESSTDMHKKENKSEKEDNTGSVTFRLGSSIHGSANCSTMCEDVGESNKKTRDAKLDSNSGIGGATFPSSRKDLPIYGGPNRVDTLRFSERESALIKFRKKRMQRCFEKKVRYHSRKQLAELRPRVKGQFVRQVQGYSAS